MKPSIFLEPKGFIKILELIFSICAFSVLVGYYSEINYVLDCSSGITPVITDTVRPLTLHDPLLDPLLDSQTGNPESVPIPLANSPQEIQERNLQVQNHTKEMVSNVIPVNYPFKFGVYMLDSCNKTKQSFTLQDKSSSEAIFFVFVGVMSFLYALAMIPCYLFLDDLFPNAQMVYAVDFFIHILWTIFWFSAAIAWTAGVTNLKSSTSEESIREQNDATFSCGTSITCTVDAPSDYVGAVVAVIFGYVNLLLFSGNVWFVFKETNFHSGNSN